MAAEKLLSEAACKAAKAKGSIYYLNDGAGLRLRVRPDGSRTWIYRYRLNGKEMSAGLGAYPTVTLQIARVKAQQSKIIAKEGHNISSAKKIAKATQATKGSNTFGLIAVEWLEHNKADWSRTHHERNEGLIRRHLLPDLAKPDYFLINGTSQGGRSPLPSKASVYARRTAGEAPAREPKLADNVALKLKPSMDVRPARRDPNAA